MRSTPTTPTGLTQLDHLQWEEAAVRAWRNPGPDLVPRENAAPSPGRHAPPGTRTGPIRDLAKTGME